MNILVLVFFFLASQTVPDGATEMTVDVGGETLKWTRTEDGKWKTTFPGQQVESFFIAKDKTMTLEVAGQPDKKKDIDMNELLKLPETLPADYWQTLKEIPLARAEMGGPLSIARDAAKKQITITQKEGPAAGKAITITYK